VKNKFTLIELLVTIAIIAILASMLFPVLGRARESAKSIACMSNMKQVGNAVGLYMADYNDWMPVAATQNNVVGEWRFELASYLGINVSDKTDTKLAEKVFKCPSWNYKTTPHSFWEGGYGWNKQYFGYKDGDASKPRVKSTKIAMPSSSAFCGDTTDWINTGTWDYCYLYPPPFGVTPSVGNRHGGNRKNSSAGGINLIWADLHVSWMAQKKLLNGENGKIDYYYRIIK